MMKVKEEQVGFWRQTK